MGQAIFVNVGNTVDYVPGTAVPEGQIVVQGQLVGIAERPIDANAQGALTVRGVWNMVKKNEQIAAGAKLYWDAAGDPYNGVAGTGALTTTVGANVYAGKAVLLAAATDERVLMLLEDVAAITNTVHNALTASIADPGAAGAIPVLDSGTCQIVTAAAETRTLAAPTSAGQMLLVTMETDGGDCVIAVATTVNQTGNNRITLNDAGDAVLLAAKVNGANLRWSVVSNDGATLSTV
jgi:predicted RecA/RadA family phage recombinase